MKKTIIAIFAMAFATILPAKISAEDTKEYNMVITLQNGTTITLGHNDIKNITFNGEEISIEGNAANSIEENKMRIDELSVHLNDLIDYLQARLNEERYRTEEEIMDVRNEMQGRISATEETINAVINMQEDNIADIKAHLDNVYQNIDYLKGYIDMLQDDSANLRTIVATLEERIAALENQK